jgi:hypothetical protein
MPPDEFFREHLHLEPFLFTEGIIYPVCILYPRNNPANIAWLCLQLIVDISVFVLTLIYTYRALQSRTPSRLLQAVLRDGTLYFLYIFSSNLIWVIFVLHMRVSSLITIV